MISSFIRSFHTARVRGSFQSFSSVVSTASQGCKPISLPNRHLRMTTTTSCAVQKGDSEHATVSSDKSSISVHFNDGPCTFHAAWLWANDPSCIHESSGQRTRSPLTFYQGWTLHSAQIVKAQYTKSPPGGLYPIGGLYQHGSHVDSDSSDNNTVLQVRWSRGQSEFFESMFDMDWLWRCRYDQISLQERLDASRVDATNAIHRDFDLSVFDYALLQSDLPETSEAAYFNLLDSLFRDGAVIVQNVPNEITSDEKAPVRKVGQGLSGGALSHCHLYGDVFHVQANVNAHNIAYTTVALPPHQDLAYYESPPGVQLLHCRDNARIVGGESTLVDAMAAAEEFRKLSPDLFQILTQCEATFIKQRQGADMVSRRPHVCLDSEEQIVSVHWSPPFEGPLAIQSHLVDDYFIAYCAFEAMLDNSIPPQDRLAVDFELEQTLRQYACKYTWEKRLEPGEILIFNNQRMLHGRRAFSLSSGSGSRHLVGCYTNIDETQSRYRLLRRERMQSYRSRSWTRLVGNGSSAVS